MSQNLRSSELRFPRRVAASFNLPLEPTAVALSRDQAAVTVSLPKRITKFEEEWITLDIDTRSGRVRNTGMRMVNIGYLK